MNITVYVVRSFYAPESHNCELFFSELWDEIEEYVSEYVYNDLCLGYVSIEEISFNSDATDKTGRIPRMKKYSIH